MTYTCDLELFSVLLLVIRSSVAWLKTLDPQVIWQSSSHDTMIAVCARAQSSIRKRAFGLRATQPHKRVLLERIFTLSFFLFCFLFFVFFSLFFFSFFICSSFFSLLFVLFSFFFSGAPNLFFPASIASGFLPTFLFQNSICGDVLRGGTPSRPLSQFVLLFFSRFPPPSPSPFFFFFFFFFFQVLKI